jgi:diadenosine tetraphosphate (Ap4A) HIT family hydrolase
MNDTIRKFGYPETLLAEYEHWVVLLRPKQVTAGSMVLACKSEARAVGELAAEAWAELARVTSDLEAAARAVVAYDRINYLALMMVDPHVHFHVLPRHETLREVGGVVFEDPAWPGPPDVRATVDLEPAALAGVGRLLREAWPSVSGPA